jgi:hypothetical protein
MSDRQKYPRANPLRALFSGGRHHDALVITRAPRQAFPDPGSPIPIKMPAGIPEAWKVASHDQIEPKEINPSHEPSVHPSP